MRRESNYIYSLHPGRNGRKVTAPGATSRLSLITMTPTILRAAAFKPSAIFDRAHTAEASDAGFPVQIPQVVALDSAPEEIYKKSGQVRHQGDIEQVHYTDAAGRILILLND